MAPIETATAEYSERGSRICRSCAQSEAAERILNAPSAASHTRRWWTSMGLSPAILHFTMMVVAYPFGPSLLEYVLQIPILNALLLWFWIFMPVFALAWLAALTWDRRVIYFRDGSSLKRSTYVLGCLGINTIVWLLVFFHYTPKFLPHYRAAEAAQHGAATDKAARLIILPCALVGATISVVPPAVKGTAGCVTAARLCS